MKKILVMFTMALMMMAVMTSCGGHKNTPSGVAEAAVKCLKKGDYKGYVDLTNAEESEKAAMVEMLKAKGEEQLKEKDGIKSYEVLDEQIDESGDRAKVKVKVVYGDGSEEEKNIRVLKEDDKWVLSSNK